MSKKFFPLLFVFVFLSQNIFSQGCSQCKLMAEQGSTMEETAFGTNINFGILYLMIIPYILILFLFRKQLIGFFKSLRKPTH